MVHFDQDEAIICADGRRMWRVLEMFLEMLPSTLWTTQEFMRKIKVNQPNVTFPEKHFRAASEYFCR